MMGWCGLDATG